MFRKHALSVKKEFVLKYTQNQHYPAVVGHLASVQLHKEKGTRP